MFYVDVLEIKFFSLEGTFSKFPYQCMGFSNYKTANMLVKVSWPRLITYAGLMQHRIHNENPVHCIVTDI